MGKILKMPPRPQEKRCEPWKSLSDRRAHLDKLHAMLCDLEREYEKDLRAALDNASRLAGAALAVCFAWLFVDEALMLIR